MKFGLNFGLLGSAKGGVQENVCMFGKTDGTWNGHIDGSGSTILPAVTIGGQTVYELKWDATDTTGIVELRLGAAGNEKEPNTDLITMGKMGTNIVLHWDEPTSRYTGTDLPAVIGINTIFVVDEQFCFSVGFIPDTLIHYDFGILETGTQI